MNDKILLVDDEPNILSAIKRQLKGKYNILTAESGNEGLDIIRKEKNFSVIVSDYMMPEMNGAEFLTKAKKLSPDTVRMMLTGQADMDAVIYVINEGNIFRFFLKPCSPELLKKNIDDGIKQYSLIQSEKELLSKTLSGSLQVMTDILALAKPLAFNRGLRIREIVKKMLLQIKIENAWQIEIAAMLSQIGCVTIPDSILNKIYKNIATLPEDKHIYQLHTKTSSDIISKIPRLEKVAKIIAYQEKYYNGSGFPRDGIKGENIPLGARILRLAIDYDSFLQLTDSAKKALETIKEKNGWYDEKLIEILDMAFTGKTTKKGKYIQKEVLVDELTEEMIIDEEIVTAGGVIICSQKQQVTKPLIIKLKNHAHNKDIKNNISVVIFVE